MKRIAFLAPFLFTLASLLQLNYRALIVASLAQVVRPLIVLWVVLLLLSLLIYWFLRDWSWTALLLTLFAAGFFSSTAFFSTVLLFTVIVGIPSWLFLRFRKRKLNVTHLVFLLSGISLVFILYTLFLLSEALVPVPWRRYQEAIQAANDSPRLMPPLIKRDIYLIILDGYARADVLQEIYGFDNSEFIHELEQQGFVVPTAAVSNYPATHLSVASMLNMDYIQNFSPGLEASYQRWLMSPFIDHSRVRAWLETQGYTTVSISTNWSITDNATTNVYYQPYPVILSDFEGFLLDSTALKLFEPLLSRFASVPSFESQRKIILYNFESLARVPDMAGNQFVVAHIIAPHPPFVFDENGNPIESSDDSFSFKDAAEYGGSREEYKERYIDQLQFINERVISVIENLLANSQTPPIIIIQADHGSGMFVDFASSENTCVRERFSPFAAYHLPEVEPALIPSDVSAVNLFRIIFNAYFAAQLPLLEHRQFYYEQPVSFYQFEDVTARQNEKCGQP